MKDAVKNFLETNIILIETDPLAFFHSAYNGLTLREQKELIDVLNIAEIDLEDARESFIRFHITMTMDVVTHRVSLDTLIDRYFVGILGFNFDWLFKYILDNQNEWDNKIENIGGTYYVYPVE